MSRRAVGGNWGGHQQDGGQAGSGQCRKQARTKEWFHDRRTRRWRMVVRPIIAWPPSRGVARFGKFEAAKMGLPQAPQVPACRNWIVRHGARRSPFAQAAVHCHLRPACLLKSAAKRRQCALPKLDREPEKNPKCP
ncbi:Two component response regulator [Herbaspirillum rubrisubalbicans M1]|nr:Two component response regulator [Herbaspirillum rubrisubalbicans M1]